VGDIFIFGMDILKTIFAWYWQFEFDMCQVSRFHLMASYVSVSTLFTHSEKSISCGFAHFLLLNIYILNLACS